MLSKKFKIIIGVVVAVFIVLIIAGFMPVEDNANSDGLVGAITIAGSTAMQPLITKSANSFMDEYQDVSITVQGGGSGTGLTQVYQGAITVGDSDVYADDMLTDAQSSKLVNHNVVVEPFAVVVSDDVGITNLTTEQLQEIFSGKITNWDELGGPDLAIVVVHRPASSGTRATFANTIMGGDKNLENDSIGITADSNGNVETTVKSTPGAIGYLALSYAKSAEERGSLKVISINGYSPTDENIEDGKYVFWSYGHMYTYGEPNAVTQAFIDYVKSPENDSNIESLGYIPISSMKVTDGK